MILIIDIQVLQGFQKFVFILTPHFSWASVDRS